MKTYNFVLVFGDVHGVWDVIPNFIRDNDLTNCAVFVAGDFGVGFEPMVKELKRLKYLSKRLKHTNSCLYAVRGNHDNPAYFTGEFDSNNVKLVPDYTVLNVNGMNVLCVGGATSVDRTNRKSFYYPKDKNKNSNVMPINDYWKDEGFVYDHDKVMSMHDVDVVITHSAPSSALPYTKGSLDHWATYDKNLLQDSRIERAQLFQLYDNLTNNGNVLKKWYYGHFHDSYFMKHFDTDFIGLNINEAVEMKL